MNRNIVTTFSVVVVSLLASIAFAKSPVGVGRMCVPAAPEVTTPEDHALLSQARYFDGTYNVGALQKRLKLTEQQKQEMQSLYTAFEDRTRDARNKFVSLLNEEKDMLRSGSIDAKKLTELDDQIAKLRSDMFRDRLKLVRDRLGLLTPSQTQMLAHLKGKMICHVNPRRIPVKREKT